MAMISAIIKGFFLVLWTAVMAAISLVTLPFNKDGNIYHREARFWSKIVLAIAGVKCKVMGSENIDLSKNYIFVSNHVSLFDIPAVVASIPMQVRIVAKKELTKIPLFGTSIKRGGYIIIDRGKSLEAVRSLEEASQKIRNGASVLLFPEGTRSKDGTLQPFKRGAFLLAAKSGIPIVPVTINGSYKILPKSKLRINSGEVHIIIDKPIATNGCEGKKGELQLMEDVRKVIAQNFISEQ